jgi:hypothetical protein
MLGHGFFVPRAVSLLGAFVALAVCSSDHRAIDRVDSGAGTGGRDG